jgi:peptidoglycan-associated lipoprotein
MLGISWNLKFAVGAIMLLALACTTPKKAVNPTEKPAFMTWDKQFVDLGQLKRGEKRNLQFTMTNVSKEDAKIDILDHCTCTTSDYPRTVIKPGAKAKIDLVFDSADKDADETIEVRIIFTNQLADGVPRIETVKYHFSLIK